MYAIVNVQVRGIGDPEQGSKMSAYMHRCYQLSAAIQENKFSFRKAKL